MSELFLGLEMVPEESHAESAIRAGKRFRQAFFIVYIGGDYLRSRISERFCLVRIRITRYRAGSESTVLVFQNCANHAATLRTGRTDYRDDFLFAVLAVWFRRASLLHCLLIVGHIYCPLLPRE